MDIIRDILTRVQDGLMERFGVPDEIIDLLARVDRDVRQEWGGERAYISKTTEAHLEACANRDNSIRRAWKDGEPIALLAQRHGISRRMIYKIVRGV